MIEIAGICFCCNDCCEYFTNPGGVKCDKGKFIEQTDMETCTNCGTCVDVCYFGARKMNLDQLSIDRDECYGCGLCPDAYPEDCIKMILRN